jgi:hypothetical protein
MVAAARVSGAWERYAWAAGIVYVIALVAETVVALGVGVNQNDSAAKIANAPRWCGGHHPVDHLSACWRARTSPAPDCPGRAGRQAFAPGGCGRPLVQLQPAPGALRQLVPQRGTREVPDDHGDLAGQAPVCRWLLGRRT